MNYYNDNDKGAVKWIKYLIKNKLIPDGEVDDRDIREIKPSDLEGFIQHHFFCGIAGWPYALRLAGWPEDRPVFTGSCPCQPFSVAGKGAGVEDERHLWPAFRWLIVQYRPGIVFGEQVSGKAGREWFDGVSADLEAINYEVGAADLPACSVGAPHIRQRLWWVAHAEHAQRWQETAAGNNDNGQDTGRQKATGGFISCGAVDNRLADTQGKRQHGAAGMPDKASKTSRYWDSFITASCRDGKRRRISTEPEIFPLAYGLSGRVALLRGIGNSIVPQVAAEFIRTFVDYRFD